MEQNAGSPIVNPNYDGQFVDIFEKLMKLYGDKGNTMQDDIFASSLLTQLMVNCINASEDHRNKDVKLKSISII